MEKGVKIESEPLFKIESMKFLYKTKGKELYQAWQLA